MSGEPKPPEKLIYGGEGEAVSYGELPLTEAQRKGKEILDALRKIIAEVKASGLNREGIKVNISLDEKLKIAVIPHTPIRVYHEDIDVVEITEEAQLLEKVSVPANLPAEGEPELLMVGRVFKSDELRAEFDPFTVHEIIAIEPGLPPGLKHEGGIRLTSKTEGDAQVLSFVIH